MPEDRIDEALDLISQYAQFYGEHHKEWLVDQVVRVLTGESYEVWVAAACDGEDGPNTYQWKTGVAP